MTDILASRLLQTATMTYIVRERLRDRTGLRQCPKISRGSLSVSRQPSLKRGRSPDQRVSTKAKYSGGKARATVIDLTED